MAGSRPLIQGVPEVASSEIPSYFLKQFSKIRLISTFISGIMSERYFLRRSYGKDTSSQTESAVY